MNTPQIVFRASRIILSIGCLALCCIPLLQAQTTSSTDGATPLGLAPGAPMGSYPLSGFDTVNLYNGSLNFQLQLLEMEGRGGLSAPVVLPIETKWRVAHTVVPHPPNQPDHFYYPTYDWWTIKRSYSPGMLTGRYSGEGLGCTTYPNIYTRTLTRLTFTAPDGTEYEMRDQASDGQPTGYCLYVTTGKNRGKVFVSKDGRAATFTSDADIFDNLNPAVLTFSPSGVLALRDGTRFRIDLGVISWMHDRNGNKFIFGYDASKRVTSITDSINRLVTISYTAAQDTITYKGFGGGSQTVRVDWASLSGLLRTGFTLQTFSQLFPTLNGSATQQCNPTLVSRVLLPNGREYAFRYNSWGELAKVTLPTGGVIEYDWGGGAGNGVITKGSVPEEKAIYRRLTERREYPDGTNLALRTTYGASVASGIETVTVDHKDGSSVRLAYERHTFQGSPAASFWILPNSYAPWQESRETQSEDLNTDASTVWRRHERTWAQGGTVSWWGEAAADSPPFNPRLTQQLDRVLDNGYNLVAKSTFGYDQYNNLTDRLEFDYGTANPPTYARRHTVTSFITTNVVDGATKNYDSDFAIHLRSLPKEEWVYDVNPTNGAQTLRSQTRFNYDRYDATTNHAALVNRSGIVNLQTGFTTSYKTRGNVTSSERWLNTSSSWVTSWTQYDIAGNPVRSIDPRNYATDFDYTDNFGTPNGEARTTTNPAELGASLKAFALVKKVTNPLGQTAYTQYDYWTGRPVDEEDLNGRVRRSSYDLMGRLRLKIFPDGGQVEIYYSDIDSALQRNGVDIFKPRSYAWLRRKVYTKIEANQDRSDLTIFDGFGRVSLAGSSNDSYLDWTKTEYHGLFGVSRTSNPLSLTPSGTNEIPSVSFDKWTAYTFDALGRVIVVTTPDGQTATTDYRGNQTTAYDQIGNGRRTITDGLSRIVTAEEPDPTSGLFPAYTTTYEYNAGDQLTKVTQDVQQRTFAYDTLGRLTAATLPEWGPSTALSGTTSYAYDPASNLTSTTDPRNVKTSWNNYDGLNRPASKSYDDVPATPTVTYTYDSAAASNGKGRLTSMSDGSGSESYGYDTMGRVSSMTRNTTGATQSLTGNYTYNYAGGLKTAVYPGVADGTGGVPLTVTYGFDNAGRTVSAKYANSATPQWMVSDYGFTYTGSGAEEVTVFGNATTETVTYNDRLQAYSRSVPGVMLFTYNFKRLGDNKNNGNVLGIVDGMASGWDFNYGYDKLNRLISTTWGTKTLTFEYDRWGNRLKQCSNSTMAPSVKFTLNTNNKNRIALGINGTASTTCTLTPSNSFTYDNAGNLTAEPSDAWTGRGSMTYQYDAESRLKSSTTGGATATYGYDGQGRRVKKTVGGASRYYFYDVLGNPVWEFYGGIWETYTLYFNGKPVFTQTAAMAEIKVWLYSDHLGTIRVKANDQGGVIAGTRLYYCPFGERLNAKTDAVKLEFTGKERDGESGLDYFGARYYAGSLGRFATPDPYQPSADVKDPASWSRYTYARNNPLRFVDPNGLAWSDLSEEQRRVFQTYVTNYNEQNNTQLSDEEVYNTLDSSQMATYESVTYALEHTQLVDSSGNDMGNALQQLAGVTRIAGETARSKGDQQFRVFADLKPGAIETFSKAQGFEPSSNRKALVFQLYHKGFPKSFRQIRREGVRGMEAGLQPSYNRKTSRADIDVDYRFGPAHLQPANSDVRAPGNYQKFIDRWPGLRNWWDKQ